MGWGTAWEDPRVLPAQPDKTGKGTGEGREGRTELTEQYYCWSLPGRTQIENIIEKLPSITSQDNACELVA